MRIEMTGVFVNDPIEAHEFYTKTLGFKEIMFVPDANLAIVASPEEPEGTSLLLEPKGTEFARVYQKELYESGLPSIVFSVDDIATEYERLKKLGVKFSMDPTKQDFGVQAVFDDTCGNHIMLVELNEGSWGSSSSENE